MSRPKIEIVFEDTDEEVSDDEFDELKDEVTELYSDGGTNKTTGDEGWGSVVQQDGRDMISSYTHLLSDMKTREVILPRGIGKRTIVVSKFNDVASQQTNGAELLALVVALRIASKLSSVKCIKCDSMVVISWATKGPLKSTKKKMDIDKLRYIEEAIKLKNEFEKRGGILQKISGDDNLADNGWHVK